MAGDVETPIENRMLTDVTEEPNQEHAQTEPDGPPAINMQNLQKSFGEEMVLKNLSLQVAKSEIFGLIGPSGSGKSTAIHLMCGHLEPTGGTVEVLEENPARFSTRTRRRIGYMPQNFILNTDLTVRQNLSFAAGLYGIGWLRARKRITAILRLVELSDAQGQIARSISGGMQRRLALAAALVHTPLLLFADEPTANLDPILRAKIWAHFREMKEQGRTIFITTQYIDEAEYCDRVGLMYDGALIAEGQPETLRRRAFGGDIVEIIMENPSPRYVAAVSDLPGVLDAVSSRNGLRVTVDDAERAVPTLLSAVEQAGGTVTSVGQYQPTFDEVFIRLIEQYRGAHLPLGGLRRMETQE